MMTTVFTDNSAQGFFSDVDLIRNLTVLAPPGHGRRSTESCLFAATAKYAAPMIPDHRCDDGLCRMCEAIRSSVCVSIIAPLPAAGANTIEQQECASPAHGQPSNVALSSPAANGEQQALLATNRYRSVLVNLIDCPSPPHLPFHNIGLLRAADGAIIVVDFTEGLTQQTKTLIVHALSERIRPVVFVNKVDCAIAADPQLQLEPEETYKRLAKIVEGVNELFETYNEGKNCSNGEVLKACPMQGTVVFGSALQGWGFSIGTFARMYANKFGVSEAKLREKLWGDSYFDSQTRQWMCASNETNQEEEGPSLRRRAFCEFCLDPIYKLFDAIRNAKADAIDKILTSLNIQLTKIEREQSPKFLLTTVMKKFLPLSDTLLQMTVAHLPSPQTAQSYRAELLYTGEASPDDKYFCGIKACDPNAPLMLSVAKMVPTIGGRLNAFCRVFAGTVREGQKVRIIGGNRKRGSGGSQQEKDVFDGRAVTKCYAVVRNQYASVSHVSSGNVCVLAGVDQFIMKTATITDDGESPHPFRASNVSASSVVRIAVQPKNPADLPRLLQGLKDLAKSDPLVNCIMEDSGETIIAGNDERYLIDVALKRIEDTSMRGCALITAGPYVSYRETIASKSSQMCLSKSSNRHNRLYCRAEPLGDQLCAEIEDLRVSEIEDRARAKFLTESHGWDLRDGRNIWSFGPEEKGPNVVVDMTKGVQFVTEIKDPISIAWQIATNTGVLCEEQMRGVRLNLEDVVMFSDAIHRAASQMMPTLRRVAYASFLTAGPRLMEPMYTVHIRTTQDAVEIVREVVNGRRGVFIKEASRGPNGMLICDITAYLPVGKSFGFAEELSVKSEGRASSECVFDHWQTVPSDPLEQSSPANEIVTSIRNRKGLNPAIPPLTQYLDKL